MDCCNSSDQLDPYSVIAEPHRDLLGDPVIMTIHGSIHSQHGGVHTYLCALTCVDQLVKTRLHHGYAEVTDLGVASVP